MEAQIIRFFFERNTIVLTQNIDLSPVLKGKMIVVN